MSELKLRPLKGALKTGVKPKLRLRPLNELRNSRAPTTVRRVHQVV